MRDGGTPKRSNCSSTVRDGARIRVALSQTRVVSLEAPGGLGGRRFRHHAPRHPGHEPALRVRERLWRMPLDGAEPASREVNGGLAGGREARAGRAAIRLGPRAAREIEVEQLAAMAEQPVVVQRQDERDTARDALAGDARC